MDDNDVYYRLIRIGDNDDIITVCCMQWFDEYDYDESRFLCAKGTNERLMFSTEEKAIKFMNDNLKQENIDPVYRLQTQVYNDNFYKD